MPPASASPAGTSGLSPLLASFAQDLRYAARTLAHASAFTLVAILSLALGIGANIALFSLMDVMLLRTLPVDNPQQLVGLPGPAPPPR
ncbi:MAG: hypothetical protein QM757_21105 [Paludibaculum sp.]